jgi:hypothetical protein
MIAKTGREQRALPTNAGEVISRIKWLDGTPPEGDLKFRASPAALDAEHHIKPQIPGFSMKL